MFQGRFLIITFLVLAVLWIPRLTFAWPSDPTVNVPICTASGIQEYPQIVSDGSGGAIIAWLDSRSGAYDIYAQRVDASGAVLWTADGVAICTASGDQTDSQIVSDGSGGAIIIWDDLRSGWPNYGIYTQRVDASGAVQWTTDGVPICTASYERKYPKIVSDGSGGAIITWHDLRSGYADIYVQRVNASGAVQWTTDGVPICTASGNQGYPQIVSDSSGGVIITWQDYRSVHFDIYAQRVDASGAVQWMTDGVPICAASGDQRNLTIVSDGSGGAIITWWDNRSGNWDIYVQRVDTSGSVQWTTDGVPICTASGDQNYPQIVSDGSGGAIITWDDLRSTISQSDIYAQRADASGAIQWTTDGVAICTASDGQNYSRIVSDGSGGVIITWQDYRSSADIYAQRVNDSGTVQWTTDGVAICTASGDQMAPQIVSDGSGGAIITWMDYRSGNSDIYAQRVFSDASLPVTLSSFTATFSDGKVTLLWRTESEVNNLGFDIYRSDQKESKYTKVNASQIQGAGTDATPHDYSFTDENVVVGKTYYYYIEDVDFSGKTNKSHILEVTVGKQSIRTSLIPRKFALLQNYPNPFNPETWIPYELAADAIVTIRIYDVKGQLVRQLDFGNQKAGSYLDKGKAAYWDGRNKAGEAVGSGIYFYEMQAGHYISVRKAILLK